MLRRHLPAFTFALVAFAPAAMAQQWLQPDSAGRTNRSSFRAITELPTPNQYRSASGTPGAAYWQQKADYVVRTSLDTTRHRVSGSERVTYHNNSPDALRFLWVQLDQNEVSREHSRTYPTRDPLPEQLSPQFLEFVGLDPFDGGHDISRVQLVQGPASAAIGSGRLVDADYRINGTVMKINLPTPLAAGAAVQFEIDWAYNVPDQGRGAKERVRDGMLYEIAQWFPRMSVYDDVNGWQTDQFYGQGEFYLNFGDYDVSITVPANHIVDATGELQNPNDVLTATQRARLAEAYRGEEPKFIIRPDEVLTAASRPKQGGTLTWRFKAENVRDFAWVSSKTYVWDAAGYTYPGETRLVKVHSLYPRDAMPLWDKVSTRATLQTLKTYGRLAFRYPYPKAVNVHGPVFGMEYPMIAFCGARPGPDGAYTPATERSLIGVTIHEVGHNWFPMIVASDERKWTWMDEGLNTFLQFYGENDYAKTYNGTAWTQTPDGDYPDRFQRGPAKNIVGYMRDPDQVPIMTESDYIHRQFGNNGYSKPATGLWMLREHILGPRAFDEAFSFYSKAWMFKHPQPADFFRAMEEGAGENLAWFWRGWFFSTLANDQAIASVERQSADSLIGSGERGAYYYRVAVRNEGGLVMPVDLGLTYADGTKERVRVPVDAWRTDEKAFTKGFFARQAVSAVTLDPDELYADVNRNDNVWTEPTLSEADAQRLGIVRPVTLTADQAARLTGMYEIQEAGSRLAVTFENGRAVLAVPTGGKFILDVVSPTQFRMTDVGITLTFEANGDGRIEGMRATGAQEFFARRVGTP